MHFNMEAEIADKIINEYEKAGYTQSVKNKILMFRSNECFGKIIARIGRQNSELFKKILEEKIIKLDYDAVKKNFGSDQQLLWALRNGKKNMGKDEKRILEEYAHKENVCWALYSYMSEFGEVNEDIMTPDGSGWGINIEVQKSPYGEDLTPKEVIIKEMQAGGRELEAELDAQTYFSKKVVSSELVDLVLQNNPRESLLKTLLMCCYQEYEKRVELAKTYAQIVENPRSIMGFLNVEKEDYFQFRERYKGYAHNLYEWGDDAKNEVLQIAMGREAFLVDQTAEDSFKFVKRFFWSYYQAKNISLETLEVLANTASATFRDSIYTKKLLYYTLPSVELKEVVLGAIENKLTSEEITNLIDISSYDAKGYEEYITKRYSGYGWKINIELEKRKNEEAQMNYELLKVKQRVEEKRKNCESQS